MNPLNKRLNSELLKGRNYSMEYNRVVGQNGLTQKMRDYMDRRPYRIFPMDHPLPEGCVRLSDGGIIRKGGDKTPKFFIQGHAEISLGKDTTGLSDPFGEMFEDLYVPNVNRNHFSVKAIETAITLRTSEFIDTDVEHVKVFLAQMLSRAISESVAQERSKPKSEWVITEKIDDQYEWTGSSRPGSIPPIDSLEENTFTRRFDKDWIEVLPENIDIIEVHSISDYNYFGDGISTMTQDFECLVMWYDIEAKEEFSKIMAQKAIKEIQSRTIDSIKQNLSPEEKRQRHLDRIPVLSPSELKARSTLRDLISEKAYRRYLINGFIMVRGKSGRYYQIFSDQRHTKVYENEKCINEICIHTNKICPPTDHVINLKMLVEFDEQEVWDGGNIHVGRDRSTFEQPQTSGMRLVDNYKELKVMLLG